MAGLQCTMNYSFPLTYEICVVGNGASCGSNPPTLPSSTLSEDRERRGVRPESVTLCPSRHSNGQLARKLWALVLQCRSPELWRLCTVTGRPQPYPHGFAVF